MKTVAEWLTEYNAILDTATPEQSIPEELDATLDAFRRRLVSEVVDPLDRLEVLDGMMEAMIERLERRVHRHTFEDILAQQNQSSGSPN